MFTTAFNQAGLSVIADGFRLSDVPAVSDERWSPSTSSTGEVRSGSDVSFDSRVANPSDPWLIFNATTTSGLPQLPKLPMVTAALPLDPPHCTVADMRNLQVSAQLLLDPIVNRQISTPRSARDILGLGGLYSPESTSEGGAVGSEVPFTDVDTMATIEKEAPHPSATPTVFPLVPPAPTRPPPSKAPVVNRWLSKHPILGSVLAPPTSSLAEPPPQKAHPVLTDAACSPRHTSPLRSPGRRDEDLHPPDACLDSSAGDRPSKESSELVVLLRQFAEDAKVRAAADEERERREWSQRQETAAAVEAAATAAKEAALRCAAVEEEARRQAAVLVATTEAEKLRQQEASQASAKAHREHVLLAATARWNDSNGKVFARCCLQLWRAEVVADKAEARMSDACAQTEAEESVRLGGCREDATDFIADAPPIIPDGFLRALQGEQVWLDMQTGAISGAALWLSLTPPKASQSFVRTFDICLPMSEADETSSTKTLDPECLGEEVLAPGSFLRSEPLSLPQSPLHSRQLSPTSRAGTPKSLAGSRGRSPKGSWGRRSPLPLSPLATASEVRTGMDDDEITPEKVLRRISGLMCEMTAMEASLGNLRQELDVGTDDEGAVAVSTSKIGETSAIEVGTSSQTGRPARRVPLRLRQQMPENLSWLQSANRPMRAAASLGPTGQSRLPSPPRSLSTGPRVSLDARHSSGRNPGVRGRPPSKVGQSRTGASQGNARGRRPAHPGQGRHRHSMPSDEWAQWSPV